MKKLLFYTCVLLSVSLFAQETGIKFEHDLSIKEVKAKANDEGKFIFVDCYTTWCGPCRKLSANVFPDSDLGAYFNANFINVKIDMEKEHGKSYSKAYNILGFPTLLFLNSDGEILNTASGDATVESLLSMGANCIANPETIAETKVKIDNGDRSTKTIRKYLDVSFTDAKPFEYSKLLDEYFLTLTEKDIYSEDSWILFVNYQNDIYSKQFQHFIQNKNNFKEIFGSEDIEYKMDEVCYYYSKEIDKGNKLYNDLRSIDPELFDLYWARSSLNDALSLCQKKQKNEDVWKEFVAELEKYAQMDNSSDYIINNACWYIWENFKTFNDKETVAKTKVWSYNTVQADPDNHLYNDTYAHLCFEVGDINEAVKYQELALKYAIRDNAEVAKWYKEALEQYKAAL